jgi:hypothetical protein
MREHINNGISHFMFVIAFALLSSRILPGVFHLRLHNFWSIIIYHSFSLTSIYIYHMLQKCMVKDCEKTGIRNNCDLRTIPI